MDELICAVLSLPSCSMFATGSCAGHIGGWACIISSGGGGRMGWQIGITTGSSSATCPLLAANPVVKANLELAVNICSPVMATNE